MRIRPISPIRLIRLILRAAVKRLRHSRKLQVSALILAIFTPLALLGLWLGREKAIASWFDDNFAYRQTVAITNSGSSQTDYQIPISLDTATLITAGKMRSDCYDIRVTDYSGALLPLWIETGTNACNTATTQIWVKVPSVPTPNNVLLIYYGNPSTSSGPNGVGPSSAEAGKSVFESFDTFDTLDTSKWTATGSPTVSGGAVALTNGQTLVTSSTVTSSSGLARVIARVKQAATTQTAGKIGFYNSNDAATIGFGNLEEKLSQIVPSNIISHHKLEETTTTDANQFKASGYLDTGKLSQAVSVYGNAAGTTGSTLTFNRGAQISGNNYERVNANQGTISFWVKPSWAGNDNVRHTFESDSSNTHGIYKETNNNIYLRIPGYASDMSGILVSASSWTANTWHHVVGRWDADNVISGSSYASLTVDNVTVTGQTSPISVSAPGTQTYIGTSPTGTENAQALIDDFAIFDRVLTTTEITSLYNSGTGNEAGYVADSSLKFYAKMDGSGTLSPVTYNGGATADQTAYNASTNTNGNMITNGNMEAATAGTPTSWSNNGTCTNSDSDTANTLFDTRSQKYNCSTTYSGSTQNITVVGSSNYTASGWAKSDGTNQISFLVRDQDNATNITTWSTTSSSWQQFNFSFKTAANNTTIKLYLENTGTTGFDFYFDNLSLTPNLVDNGGMEGVTSSNVDNWTKNNMTEDNAQTTPHSGTYAIRSYDDSASNAEYVYQSLTLTANTWYLASAWVRAASGTGNASIGLANFSDSSGGPITISTTTAYAKISFIFKTGTDTTGILALEPHTWGTASLTGDAYFDDVSVIPLDNTALSFQSWAPADDVASAGNDLSIHGDSDGVSSNTSGELNNAYTFDGSTGYLRQKTYLTNIGTLTYGTNALTDTGQTFTSYKASPATYMIVVTNSDNTTSWGYIGTTSGATIVDVFTTKALSVAGWNGTSPSGKTPVGYEVRKTDFQVTGSLTVGAWVKTSGTANRWFISKSDESSNISYRIRFDTAGTISGYVVGSGGTGSTGGVTSVLTYNNDSWHYVAMVVDTASSQTTKLYVDGSLVATDDSSPATLTDTYVPFIVGATSVVNQYFIGSIDSPFVLNTALTADQIAALYQYHSLATTNNSTISVINGSATPTNDTNYHTYLLTAGSASTTAASDNTVFATSSTNLHNEAVNLRLMNSDATNALTVDWVAVAKQAGTAPTVAAPATEEKGGAPVAYWKFDDGTGTNAQDSSPNNNDGTITGASWQTEDMCVSGKCLKYNGTSSDYVTAANESNFDFSDTTFTTSGWFKTGATGAGFIVSKQAASNIGGWSVDINNASAGKLSALIKSSNGSSAAYRSTSTATFNDNKWHYFSVVFTTNTTTGASNDLSIYVDGVLNQGSVTRESVTYSATDQALLFGKRVTGSYFNGFIDDIKIYNYARTAAQVKSDFASRGSAKGSSASLSSINHQPSSISDGLVGYWKMDEATANSCTGGVNDSCDSSGNANNGAWNGDATTTTGKFGNGTTFDGTGDYIQMTNLLSSGTFTISTWFNASALSGTQNIIAQGNSGGTFIGMHLSSTNIRGYVDAANALTNTTTLSTSTWYHATLTYDPNRNPKTILYLNGQQEATQNNNASFTGDKITIGISPTTSSLPFSGKIDETRIYNRALSPREVRDLYNWAPGPVGYWNFEEGSGQSANDTSGNGNTGTLGASSSVASDDPTWASGKYGKGLSFDGGDYVDTGSGTNLASTIWSAESWVKLNSFSNNPFILLRGDAGTSTNYYIQVLSSGIVEAGFFASSDWRYVDTSDTISTGVWNHLSATFDGTFVKIYINGILKATSSNFSSYTPPTSTATLRIGKTYLDIYNTSGFLDDVKIYNYARTQKQIVEDMEAGSPSASSGSQVAYFRFDEGYGTTAYDNSINANNLTLSTASWTNSGKFGKAWNGTGALRLSRADDADFDVTATDDYAMSLWFKSDSATNPSAIEYLVNKASSVIAGYAVYANTSGQICFGIDDDTTWNPDIASCSTADFYDATWHHIAAIRDTVQDKTYIYIDGVLKDSDSDTTTATLANSLLLYVGDRDGTDNGDEFNGDIDELKIYRYALTSDEVKTEYNHGAALALGSDAAYCIPGDASTCSAPVGEWNFEEGSGASAQDSSGNGNTGTWSGTGTHYTSGKYGKGGKFTPATSDYVTVNASSSINSLPNTAFTAETWINLANPLTGGSAIYRNIFNKNWVFDIYWDTVNTRFWFYQNMSTQAVDYRCAITLQARAWNHIALTYTNSGNIVKLYLNGKDVTCTATTAGSGTYAGDSGALKIGDRGSSTFFDGSMDQVRIFNYARTPAQIAWDYNRGGPVGHWKLDECQGATAYDLSGKGNNGTITIGASGTQTAVGDCSTSATTAWYSGRTGKYNSSLNFDGTDDYVAIPDSTSLRMQNGNQLTVSAWAYSNSTTGNHEIINKLSSNKGFMLLTSGTTVQFYIGTGSAYVTAAKTSGVATGSWYHILGVYDGSNTKLYINGILSDTKTSTTYQDDTNQLTIGVENQTGNGEWWNGQIDDVQIFNYALTATQIKNLFNQNSAIRFGPQTGSP